MKIIVISGCDIVREGILAIVSRQEDISVGFAGKSLKEVIFMIRGKLADIILLDIYAENEEALRIIEEITSLKSGIKLVVMDLQERRELFLKALKSGVHGYITGKSSEEEIIYAINQVYRGNKYFDSCFVDHVLKGYIGLPEKNLLPFR